MKTTATIIMLAALALAGMFAVRARQEAVENRAVSDALFAQRVELQTATATTEQRLRTVSAALAKLEQKVGQATGEPGKGAGAAENATATGNDTTAKAVSPTPKLTATTIIANDPRKLADFLQGYRADLDLRCGGMFKALGFSAEQVEKIKDLWILKAQQLMDLDAAVEMQGLDRNSDAVKKLRAEVLRTEGKKERELFGDLWNAYREYSLAEGVRNLVKELAGTAFYSGEVMTLAQVERTTQILTANSQRGKPGYGIGSANPATINWLAASVQLSDVLSPTQIVTLKEIVEYTASQAKATERRDRLDAEFKAKQAAK